MAGIEGIKDTGIITDPGINPNTTQNDVTSTQHASHQATDTTITNTPASIKSEHVKDTTEDVTNAVLPGTAAHDEAEAIETDETKNDQQATDPVITAQIRAISATKDTI